jgi:hypothetical protein
MAQNFQSLTRHIVGDVYYKGGTVIIDRNCNIQIPNSQITANTGSFNGSVEVKKDLCTDLIKPRQGNVININGSLFEHDGNIFAKTFIGNIQAKELCVPNFITSNVRSKTHDPILIQSATQFDQPAIFSNIAVDQICRIASLDHITIKDQSIFNSNVTMTANLMVSKIKALPSNSSMVVCGNVEFQDQVRIGSAIYDQIITSNVLANTICSMNDIFVVQGNTAIDAKPLRDEANVCQPSQLYVDRITERNFAKGLCLGYPKGGVQFFTNLTSDTSNNVMGDALWQSFQVPFDLVLSSLKPQIIRAAGFENTPMEAQIFEGIGTGGNLVGSVIIPSYNGGSIDFSALNLELLESVGNYTLLLDFPVTNLSNYLWLGHEKQPGESDGADSLATLHIEAFLQSNGVVKINPMETCIENKLKLEFEECDLTFNSSEKEKGAFGEGFVNVDFSDQSGAIVHNKQIPMVSNVGNVGDLLVHNGNCYQKLEVSGVPNGWVLTRDDASPVGISWQPVI